ncbi:hypothetical protein [Haloplasma contractile]|uniref:Uncharacterized protein n=1 Tax=Haloplasma contractile SSD-17B TaxID=1033810 RepID=U2FK89_9MOLU|nr:hypothetical protein [Haloplasma contractile]ERJ13230.1 hypothetical protein HLPCO_000854 [Haloplasma contractile SSD-17B]
MNRFIELVCPLSKNKELLNGKFTLSFLTPLIFIIGYIMLKIYYAYSPYLYTDDTFNSLLILFFFLSILISFLLYTLFLFSFVSFFHFPHIDCFWLRDYNNINIQVEERVCHFDYIIRIPRCVKTCVIRC